MEQDREKEISSPPRCVELLRRFEEKEALQKNLDKKNKRDAERHKNNKKLE